MSVENLHVLYAVNTPSGLIDQISDQSVDLGIEQLIQAGDGKVDPEFAATITQEPVLGFTTPALKKALDIAGISGLSITSAIQFFFQKIKSGGTREVGLNHVKLTAIKGLLVPRSLRASVGSEASIDYELLVGSPDGFLAPIGVDINQALAGAPTESEKFTVGPVKINGTLLKGVQETTVDFGIAELLSKGDGSPYNTFLAITERRPTITVRLLDALTLDTFRTQENIPGAGTTSHPGQVAISPNIQISFWKIKSGGVREDPDDAVHVVLTITKGRMVVRTVGGTGNDPQVTELSIMPLFDGVNDIMAISTDAVLPA